MTIREAVIQAHMEMGSSREAAERRIRASDVAFPGARLLSRIPIPSTAARKLIEKMKQLFRRMDADPELRQAIAGRQDRPKRADRCECAIGICDAVKF